MALRLLLGLDGDHGDRAVNKIVVGLGAPQVVEQVPGVLELAQPRAVGRVLAEAADDAGLVLGIELAIEIRGEILSLIAGVGLAAPPTVESDTLRFRIPAEPATLESSWGVRPVTRATSA